MKEVLLNQIESVEFENLYTEMRVLSDLISATEKSLYLEKYYTTRGYDPDEYFPIIQEMENSGQPNANEPANEQTLPTPETNKPETPPAPQQSGNADANVNQSNTPDASKVQPQSNPSGDNKLAQLPDGQQKPKQDVKESQPDQQPQQSEQQPEQSKDQNPQLPQTNWEKFKQFVKDLIHKITQSIGKMIDSLFGGKSEADAKQSEASVQNILKEEPDADQTISELQEIVKNATPVDGNGGEVTESYIDTDLMYIEYYERHSDEFYDLYEEAVLNDVVKGLDAAFQLISGQNIVEGFRTAGQNLSRFVGGPGKVGFGLNKAEITKSVSESIAQNAKNLPNDMAAILTAGISNHTDLTESYGAGGPTKFVQFGPVIPPDWDPKPAAQTETANQLKNVLRDLGNQILKKANDAGFLDTLMEGRNENNELVGWYGRDPNIAIEEYNKPGGPKPIALLTNENGFSYGGNIITDTVNQVRGFKRMLDIFRSSGSVVTDLMQKFGANPPACLQTISNAIDQGMANANSIFGTTDLSLLTGAKGKFFLYLGLDVTKKTIVRVKDKNNNENNVFDALLGALWKSLDDMIQTAQRAANTVDEQIQNQMIVAVSQDSNQVAEALNNVDKFFTQDGEGSIIDLVTTIRNSDGVEANRFKAIQKAMVDLDTLMNDPNNPIGKAFTTVAGDSLPKNENTGRSVDANAFDAKEAAGDITAHTPIPKTAYGLNQKVGDTINKIGDLQQQAGAYDPNKQATSNNHTVFTRVITSFFQGVSWALPILHYLCGLSNDVLNFAGAMIDGASAAHDARLNQGEYGNQYADDAFKNAYNARMEQNGGFAGGSNQALKGNQEFRDMANDNAILQQKLNSGATASPNYSQLNLNPT